MNKYFIIAFILFLFLGCKQDQKAPSILTSEEHVKPFDTIKVDLDSIHFVERQRNERWSKMDVSELINALKTLELKKGITKFKDSEKLFGNYTEMGKYYSNNIPRSIYTRLFPNDEISIKKEKILEYQVDSTKKVVYQKEGTIVQEERTYKYLFAMEEKENYLHLIFTKQGKYSPELEYITLRKEDFKVQEKINIYGGIYDSYDINYWYTEFLEDYTKLVLTKVENLSSTEVQLDTTEIHYQIQEDGELKKMVKR